jgi:uncharacterized protein YegP (UPF0339 family)
MPAKFTIFMDTKGEFKWRLDAPDGETIATSKASYETKDLARANIKWIKENAPSAEIAETRWFPPHTG